MSACFLGYGLAVVGQVTMKFKGGGKMEGIAIDFPRLNGIPGTPYTPEDPTLSEKAVAIYFKDEAAVDRLIASLNVLKKTLED